MGCAASKAGTPITPAVHSSEVSVDLEESGELLAASSSSLSLWNRPHLRSNEFTERSESGESGKQSSGGTLSTSVSFRLTNLHRYIEGEQSAAGWPAWLTAVAGEAIQGWVPLKADAFEKLEKIGQGTYSTVFRAREIETGKIVALKKVHFDTFEPESVRFMAREIQILRRLDHPNVTKLEGLITSRLSCSLYLVFEYMEHDLAGLSSNSDIKFSESQVKCYMHQILSGVEHCHSRGVIHRDIKCANLLVNNEGIVKVADFGLANFLNPEMKQPLTSRVVTLWYRPPELLLGSTDYDASVDLWSVGCVFAELLLGKPVMQGRTEVEQIHKIFKLCGSPPDEYWTKCRLPHATVFKPQHPYDSCLEETFEFLPESALILLETLLSIEPYKRGRASTHLISEYFRTKPYACEPSSLPKYPPNKEIDAKFREETRRKSLSGKMHSVDGTRRPSRESRPSKSSQGLNGLRKPASSQEGSRNVHRTNSTAPKLDTRDGSGDCRLFVDLQPLPLIHRADEDSYVKQNSQKRVSPSDALHVDPTSGFSWAKSVKENQQNIKPHARTRSRQHPAGGVDTSNSSQVKSTLNQKRQEDAPTNRIPSSNIKGRKPNELLNHSRPMQWPYPDIPGSLHSSDDHRRHGLLKELETKDVLQSKPRNMAHRAREAQAEFSGPLLFQPKKVDELLQRNERHIRQAVRRTWLQREKAR